MTEQQFRLPDVGEGLTEADIVTWRVKPGDTVTDGQTIVEIETAKAVVELPSPYDGVVTQLLVDEGQTVDVGTPIIAVDTAGGAPAPPAREDTAPAAPESTAPAPATPTPAAPERQPVLGIDLSQLTGTGPAGSITRDDIQQARDRADRPSISSEGAREERVPVRGVRKHTAEAVAGSAFTAPHVTEFLEVDVTATMEAVARVRALPEFAGVRVSPLLFVARALLTAVSRHPMINSSWDGQAQEIVVKHYVNLGFAAATERGLLVPNIKDAQALALPELARAFADLTATARDGRCTPAQLTGGTITITNVGVFGVDAGTPILTPGEAAILAFGRIREAPWVHDGQLAVRQVTTLSLSFDHRIVDGELGSAVLRDLGQMLEDPIRMLAWA
jgi:pyruvate dehydrogenase E2 component (dihydrolipoamide acetyltransferase)